MAHLYRLIFACLVYLLCLPVFAAFPATPGGQQWSCGASPGYGGWHNTTQAAIEAMIAGVNASSPDSYRLPGEISGGSCLVTLNDGRYVNAMYAYGRIGPDTCPANATLSGSNCNCNSGFVQEGNQCIDVQVAACQALSGQSIYIQVPGRALPGSTVCGATGCQMTVSGTVIIGKQGGATITEGDATFTATPCTPDPASQAAPDTCPNGQPGQVNGVDVCIPYSGSSDLETVKEEQEEKNDSESGQEQKSTTKQTICNGNSCTTTTTTTTVVNGGAPKTTTTEKTESKDDFCTVNPKAPQCTSSSFGGSCGSFTCAGDAVQCAIAREQHTRNCQMFSATNQETQQYETSKTETGNRTDAVPVAPMAISPGSFDQTPVFGAGACIADLQVTVWGSQLALPLSTICPQLEWLRALLLTISFLLAVRIVSRG